MTDKPEIHLIAAAKLGDRAATTELFERHYPSSLRAARRILRSEDEAQDAVQSGYLSAFRHLRSFRGDAAFKTWITRIVTNHCLMRLRQPSHRGGRTEGLEATAKSIRLASPTPTPETSAFHQELASALASAAASLPKTLCEVFRLHSVSGLSLKQVAAETGLTLPAAKSRLFRAHARMRKSLEPVWSNGHRSAAWRTRARALGREIQHEAA